MSALLPSLVLLAMLGASSPSASTEPASATAWAERLPAFASHHARRWVIVSDVGADRARRLGEVLERTTDAVEAFGRAGGAGRDGRQAAHAQERFLCIAFAERDAFERFAREHDRIDARWMMGYWASGDERIVLRVDASSCPDGTSACETMATAAHEAAHQMLHRRGIQRASTRTPLAILEGLAMQFETCAEIESGGVAFGAQPARERRLRMHAAAKADSMPSLRLLVTAPRMPSMEPEEIERFYDASWSLVRFLHARDPDALSAYLAALAAESDTLTRTRLITLFERQFGPTGSVESAWLRWMRGAGDVASGAGRRAEE